MVCLIELHICWYYQICYNLSKNIFCNLGNLPEDVILSYSVKYVPGDPTSPYVEDPSSKQSMGN